jgi:membrane-associated phospholipid phosphatase
MSFPSGHAAVAAGLATALAWKYPHGLPVFACLAAAAAAQRLFSSAHYPSDVLFGAACGVAAAAVCLGVSRPSGGSAAA